LNTVLVYGTLRPFKNEEIVHVPGYLYDLGWYPGIALARPSKTDSVVVCERIHVDNEKLEQLDRYEGYDADYKNESLYLRERIADEGSPNGWSWIYTYNKSFRSRPVVESGDWEQHTKQKEVV